MKKLLLNDFPDTLYIHKNIAQTKGGKFHSGPFEWLRVAASGREWLRVAGNGCEWQRVAANA